MSEELSKQIKAARAKLGLTQAQAAQAWGLNQRTLENYEASKSVPRGLAAKALQDILAPILAVKRKSPSSAPPAKVSVAKSRRKKQ